MNTIAFLMGVLASIVASEVLDLSPILAKHVIRRAAKQYIPEEHRCDEVNQWLTHIENMKDGPKLFQLVAALQIYFVAARQVGGMLEESKEVSNSQIHQNGEDGFVEDYIEMIAEIYVLITSFNRWQKFLLGCAFSFLFIIIVNLAAFLQTFTGLVGTVIIWVFCGFGTTGILATAVRNTPKNRKLLRKKIEELRLETEEKDSISQK